MTKIVIDLPSGLHNDMTELFDKKELCRTEGLDTDCKINVDFLLAQMFHPFNQTVGHRQLALRQNGKTKNGLPHLEFIEVDNDRAGDPVINMPVSAKLLARAKAFASLRDQTEEEYALEALVSSVTADTTDLGDGGISPEEEEAQGKKEEPASA